MQLFGGAAMRLTERPRRRRRQRPGRDVAPFIQLANNTVAAVSGSNVVDCDGNGARFGPIGSTRWVTLAGIDTTGVFATATDVNGARLVPLLGAKHSGLMRL